MAKNLNDVITSIQEAADSFNMYCLLWEESSDASSLANARKQTLILEKLFKSFKVSAMVEERASLLAKEKAVRDAMIAANSKKEEEVIEEVTEEAIKVVVEEKDNTNDEPKW